MENLYRIGINSQNYKQKLISISEEQYREIYPDELPKKKSFLFLKDYVLLVDFKIAEFLTGMYPEIMLFDEFGQSLSVKDDLDLISGNKTERLAKLFTLACEYHLDVAGLSESEIKIRIRMARNESERICKAV
ncbi:MAG: hypothetical protein CSB55_01175 [Candidatus Cloacimonadota bacterium]|nr:MAG: hypothetical protein CSB55_01175 [Candidatus Cloacimonadota bacterium]